jgi:hypothetical protein
MTNAMKHREQQAMNGTLMNSVAFHPDGAV